MRPFDSKAIRMLSIVAVVVLAFTALQVHPLDSDEGEAMVRESRDGDLEVQEVYNNYTQPLQIYVSPVDGDSLVDPFVPLLERGGTAGPATLNCTLSEWGEATDLRVVAYSTEEGEKIADRRADLRPVDCEAGGRVVFDVTVTRGGNVSIAKA